MNFRPPDFLFVKGDQRRKFYGDCRNLRQRLNPERQTELHRSLFFSWLDLLWYHQI
jgi:hypothetical protein